MIIQIPPNRQRRPCIWGLHVTVTLRWVIQNNIGMQKCSSTIVQYSYVRWYLRLQVHFVLIFLYTIFKAFRTWKDVFVKFNANLWRICWKFKKSTKRVLSPCEESAHKYVPASIVKITETIVKEWIEWTSSTSGLLNCVFSRNVFLFIFFYLFSFLYIFF